VANSYRWLRPLAIAATAFVVTAAFQTHPGPGTHGRHLAVSAALVALAVAMVAMVRLAERPVWLLAGVLVVVIASSATLVALQPDGLGFLAMFPAVSGGGLRLPIRTSRVIAGVAVGALAAAWTVARQHPVVGVVLNEFGVLAFYVIAMFARRLRESNDHAQRLIVELEASREARAEAAALAERQRLAREMHDVLAHSLSGLLLNLEGARLLARRQQAPDDLVESLDRAHRLAKAGLVEARRAIAVLRDDELPGAARIAELAAEFEQDSGAPCHFDVVGAERELGSDGRLTLYRVAQEALTNIRKHAQPQRVELQLSYEPAGARLTVEDFHADHGGADAIGLLPRDGTGYGLTGMRERAELLGGTLAAGRTEHGFRVELWVPG